MITLKEAFKLCRIQDREVVQFCDDINDVHGFNSLHRYYPMTGKQVRKKYDMLNTYVTAIDACIDCDGEYEGFVFEIKTNNGKERT